MCLNYKYLKANYAKLLGQGIVMLTILQLVVVFVSWLCAAVFPKAHIQSLLSSDGIRWQYGQFVAHIASTTLVWILLIAISWGSVYTSKLHHLCIHADNWSFRQKTALRFILGEWIIYITVSLALTCLPHAVLLGVDGHFLTGCFVSSLIPQLALMVILNSVTYGYIVGTIKNTADLYKALTCGLSRASAVILYDIILTQLIYSIQFVF